MANDFVKTYHYPNGELQRVHVFKGDSFSDIDFIMPEADENSFSSICMIYDNYLVKAAPYIFGRMLLFSIPGASYQEIRSVYNVFSKGIRITRKGEVRFSNHNAKVKYEALALRGKVHVVCGLLPKTQIIPVGNTMGYLSKCVSQLSVNSSFFIFDRFDCASEYDQIGIPFGLMVKDGRIISPPLFDREAFIVRNGASSIEKSALADIGMKIGNHVFKKEKNCRIYSRPEFKTVRKSRQSIVVVGDKVVDVVCNQKVIIPASGFVIVPNGKIDIAIGDEVKYLGLEDVEFAIQVGNSAVVKGSKTTGFISRFFNIRKLITTPFPPSLYPPRFDKDRAARIVLGADKDEKPYVVWFEGASKSGYQKGIDSCGATLSEVGDICLDLGLYNAVNLDGGGSAQMLVNGDRSLMISDRNPETFAESERPIPVGLCIKRK